MKNLPQMGKVAPQATDGMTYACLHFHPKKLFRQIKHQSSPLSLRDIPPFKGGLTQKAAEGRRVSQPSPDARALPVTGFSTRLCTFPIKNIGAPAPTPSRHSRNDSRDPRWPRFKNCQSFSFLLFIGHCFPFLYISYEIITISRICLYSNA